MVPAWHGYAGDDWRGYINNSNATAYGNFLGSRYGNKNNIMWTLGGDNNPDTANESIRNIKDGLNKGDITQATRNMGVAIQQRESIRHLMSYHANRRFSSTQFFNNDAWHTVAYAYTDLKAYQLVLSDYEKTKVRPVINPETYYDQQITLPSPRGPFILTNEQLRAQAYYTYYSGGVGYAYGNERIWDVDPDWRQRINDPSAFYMTHVKNLLENYKQELLPDHRSGNSRKLLTNGYGTYNTLTYAVSARTIDDRVGLAYFPNNRSITVNMAVFNGGNVRLRWFNPNSGAYQLIGTYAGSGTRQLTYPSGFSDAVLVAEKQ